MALSPLLHLLDHNKAWAASMERERPGFFTSLTEQQSPRYMWVGCSDSRVPANQITGLEPGEVFVHRNVANVVVHTDLNALSTIQYAVDVLKVEHIIVCGHYGCGGVLAALHNKRIGLADNWIRHIQDIRDVYARKLAALPAQLQANALCELNVIHQVLNVAQSNVLQDAWGKNQKIAVHGWVYGLSDGILQDLTMSLDSPKSIQDVFSAAVAQIFNKTNRKTT